MVHTSVNIISPPPLDIIRYFILKKTRSRAEKQEHGVERENEEDGRVIMKSSGGGKGAQFDEAALNQPITVKENVSWCVSS